METGSLLKILRTTEGLSQTKLALELNIARTYLSQIENNKAEPGFQLLKKISHKFKIPLSLLVVSHTEENNELVDTLEKLVIDVLSARLAIRRR